MEKIDPEEYRKRRDALYNLLEEMVSHASDQAKNRCPYKNRHDQCTATFGCRNKRKNPAPGELPICVGDDKLNYKSAWES